MRQPSHTSPECDVDNVEVRQNAPQPVDLRIVAIDLGHNQRKKPNGKRGSETRNQGVRCDIELPQGVEAVEALPDLVG